MKKALLLSMLVTLFLWQYTWAQSRLVTGTVRSATDNSPLPGVNVVVKGTTNGTTTGADGTYSLEAPNVATLVFSFIGFTTQEVPVGNKSVVDIQLVEDITNLSEVVVTAFGIEREKKSLAYTSQPLEGAQIAAAGNPNLANALQGKVAGAIVRQSSGMPGASSYVTIRGARSLDGNNQPLYVVDGMPIESDAFYSDNVLENRVSSTDGASRTLDINPDDIESINILKGPAASALYGLRATNGVVVITTKRGKGLEKGRISVTYNTNYTIDKVSRLPDLQTTYAQGSGGVLSQGTSMSWGPRIDTLAPYALRPGGIPASILNITQQPQAYDNISPLFRTGGTYNTSIDVSGAGNYGNYSTGFGYTNQNGVLPNSAMRRYTAKFGGDFNLTEQLKLGVSGNYSDLNIDKLPGGSDLSNPLFTTYYAPVTYNLWGLPYSLPDDPYFQIHYRGAIDNPRWSIANNKFNEKTRRFFGNINLNYQPLPWLSLNYRLGTDYFIIDGKEVYNLGSGNTGGRGAMNGAGEIVAEPAGGEIQDWSFYQNQINSNFNATINKDITEDLNINLLVGSEFYDIRNRRMSMIGSGMSIGGFFNIDNTANQIVEEIANNQRTVGFYSNLAVGWKDMIYLTGSGRNDFVSNMPRGNRSFFYPSVGLSFVFTEAFKLPSNIISFGKVRASYAQVGQTAPLPYVTRNVFIKGGSGVGGFLTDGIQFPFNGVAGFTQDDILRSDELRPQNTSTIEAGIELKFLNNRIGIDYTFYNSRSVDQIFKVPIALSTGYTEEYRNAGELTSRGHEVVLTATPVRSINFEWNATVNYSTYKNEVISLAEGVENIYLGGFTEPQIRAQAGSQYPIIFGNRYLRDASGNIVIDSRPTIDGNENPGYGMPIVDPVQGPIGNVQPDFEASLINTFRFKGLSLTAQIDWRQGGKMYSGNNRLLRLYGIAQMTEDRTSTFIEPGVKGYLDENNNVVVEGINDIPIQHDENYWRFAMDAISESQVYSTTFVRFRELVLNYDFPSAAFTKIRLVKGASVYFTARNLFLITDYPNFDPETSLGGAGNFQGFEYVSLPQSRSYGAGLRVKF